MVRISVIVLLKCSVCSSSFPVRGTSFDVLSCFCFGNVLRASNHFVFKRFVEVGFVHIAESSLEYVGAKVAKLSVLVEGSHLIVMESGRIEFQDVKF